MPLFWDVGCDSHSEIKSLGCREMAFVSLDFSCFTSPENINLKSFKVEAYLQIIRNYGFVLLTILFCWTRCPCEF